MIPGTFLFDPHFVFKDGNKGEKIFVVLNNGNSGSYITAKTTSRGDRYGIEHGCQIFDRFPNFFFVQGSCFLIKNSWIQLDAFYEFKTDRLIDKVCAGQIHQIGVLENVQMSQLLNCSSHSEDLSYSQEKVIQSTISSLQPVSSANVETAF